MKITEKVESSGAVFVIEGRLDSITSSEVEKTLISAIERGTPFIVLDLHLLNYISSTGIRVLLRCHKALEKTQGQIVLASVPKEIENILYLTGFLPYFKIFDDPVKAMKDSKKSAP